MNLYENRFNDNFNVQINGVDLFAEEVTSDESFSRNEIVRQNILGGTQFVSKGAFVPKKYSFTTHLSIPAERPDFYDSLFNEWVNNPAEVVSPEFGGMFMAELTIKKEHTAPKILTITFNLTEIPE